MSTKPSTPEPLRVGVVGVGFVGRAHLKTYQKMIDADVVALADVNRELMAHVGETFGVTDQYDTYEALVARDDIDVVSVCTPNYLHAPVAIAALEAGKHVLCEKPMAISPDEGEAMVEAAIQAGRVLKTVFNHRARSDVRTLKHYLETDGVGRIYYAKARWLRRVGIPGLGSWFTTRRMSGGGPLIDLGVHMLDMALYLMGEPTVEAVSAATYAELGPKGRGGWTGKPRFEGDGYDVEDLATAFLRLEGGGSLFLETSWAAHRDADDVFGVSLFGTEGGAEIKVTNYTQDDTLRIYADVAGVPSDIRPHLGDSDGHLTVMREFFDIVRSGAWGDHVGHIGLARTRIIDACYRSAEEGREVSLV